MLRKDQKGSSNAAEARQNLIDRCRVSCDLRTPRMLAAVAQLLPPDSQTTKRLEKALGEDGAHPRPPKQSRLNTLPAESELPPINVQKMSP
uniref:Uncharacterized protein n=1 Tax=Globodera pallida TaxID=36090 RepID=A0A183BQ15_GLOPA